MKDINEIIEILNDRIEDMKEENIPMNSVMGGILLGLIEARDLILEEDDD